MLFFSNRKGLCSSSSKDVLSRVQENPSWSRNSCRRVLHLLLQCNEGNVSILLLQKCNGSSRHRAKVSRIKDLTHVGKIGCPIRILDLNPLL